MSSFKEMKDLARKVDEGITNLEYRLEDPYKLSFVTSRSASKAAHVIDQIQNEIVSMQSSVENTARIEKENLEDNHLLIDAAEKILEEVHNELTDMNGFFEECGLRPFSRNVSNSDSSNVDCESSEKQSSGNSRRFICNESPVFTSPNYSSTPESYLCGSSNENKSNTRFLRIKQWSVNNRSTNGSSLTKSKGVLTENGKVYERMRK